MTPFRVEPFRFDKSSVTTWGDVDPRHRNWPVVYVIDGKRSVYVGETTNAAKRMLQHLGNDVKKKALRSVRVIIDDEFNKSACLDLEAHLIRWLHADEKFTVLNGNEGVIDADYYRRDDYRRSFREIFEQLRDAKVFERTIPEIENSDLFKLSPFKALTLEQAGAVEDILDGLFDDLRDGAQSTSIIEGQPGTGKTIVAIFLMKMLADIRDHDENDEVQPDSVFADLFVPENVARLQTFRMALVVPQQSLRKSLKKVFRKTPNLRPDMIVSPFQAGAAKERYDLLIVDEAHRLNQRANMSAGPLNRQYIAINETLFGVDDPRYTQLDWIKAQSAHRILLVDTQQTVRPADLPIETVKSEIRAAAAARRRYPLVTQMRVKAGEQYIDFIRRTLRGDATARLPELDDYELRFFDDLGEMHETIFAREKEHGLARVVAGYAWDWRSKKEKGAVDIALDGLELQWNRTQVDWIGSETSISEVGSIHTVQGYDLNYAGVIIGPDLRYDVASSRLVTSRDWIRDAKGKQNNGKLGRDYTDDELLEYIQNIYGVLLTRGIRGTFVYVCDPALREWMRERLSPGAEREPGSVPGRDPVSSR